MCISTRWALPRIPILRAVGVCVAVVSVVEVPVVEVPDDEVVPELAVEELDPVEEEEPVDVEPVAEALSVRIGGTNETERKSIAILRMSARASCDRSISSRPLAVNRHD